MSELVVQGQELLSIPAALAPLTAAGNSGGSGLSEGCEVMAVIAVRMTQSPKNAALGTAARWLCRGVAVLDGGLEGGLCDESLQRREEGLIHQRLMICAGF